MSHTFRRTLTDSLMLQPGCHLIMAAFRRLVSYYVVNIERIQLVSDTLYLYQGVNINF